MAAEVQMVPKAREFAADQLLRHGGRRELVDDVRIIVDELVANAVVHSGTDNVALTIATEGPSVLIVVTDFGAWRVHTEVATRAMTETGRGLGLVAALSTSSGVCTKPYGTCAWASVSNVSNRVGALPWLERTRELPGWQPKGTWGNRQRVASRSNVDDRSPM
ncbi:ATP-binding protein [Streptomyces spiralis]